MKTSSKKEAYSSFKMVHQLDKLHQINNGELPLPIFAQMDLTNLCNLSCRTCFYRGELRTPLDDWNPKLSIPKKTALKTLREMKQLGVKALEWTGGGSVECHPHYKEILSYAKTLGFEQALVTNGTLLDKEAFDIIRDFQWVRFSIDASTSRTYQTLKGDDLFHKTIENLRRLIKIRSDHNVVGFSFVIEPLNHTEIVSAAEIARNLGCDNIRFSLAMTPRKEALFDGIWTQIVEEIEKAKTLETEEFSVFAFANRIYQLSSAVLSDFCAYHHLVAVIAPSGVYPCCRLKDNSSFNFGDINKEDFVRIWFGEKRQKFIKSIENGCPYDCWMTDKNRFATYLMKNKEDVRHVNFV